MDKSSEQSALEQFAVKTSIHGIRDFHFSKNRIWKCTWGILILVTLVGMCEEFWRSLKTFKDAPTAMQLNMIPLKSWPMIYICTMYWYDESKALAKGFNMEDLALVRVMFGMDYRNSYRISNNLSFPEAQKENLRKIMAKNNLTTIDQMIGLFSWDVTTHPPSHDRVKRLMGIGELCHVITPSTPQISIDVPVSNERIRTTRIVVGDDRSQLREYDYLDGPELKMLEISKSILLNRPEYPCNPNVLSEYICEKDCQVRWDMCKCNGAMKRFYFNTSESFLNIDPPMNEPDCTYLESQTCDQDYDLCLSNCNPCIVFNYVMEKTLKGFPGFWMKSTAMMRVSTEYYMYPATSLLGNVGGLISLFCGASILSIVQLVVFCWEHSCKKPKVGSRKIL